MFVNIKKSWTKFHDLKNLVMAGTRSTPSLSTSTDSNIIEVINNLKEGNVENNGKELLVLLKGTHYAKICFKKNKQTYDLQHTEIPDEYQGKGLGSIFAEKILSHLIEQDKTVKIKLSCEYLQHFCEKNKMKYDSYIEK